MWMHISLTVRGSSGQVSLAKPSGCGATGTRRRTDGRKGDCPLADGGGYVDVVGWREE